MRNVHPGVPHLRTDITVRRAEVLVTHTKELGQILSAVHSASSKIGGSADIPTAIAIAQLALKHRQNKNLRQRIVVFVASPLEGAGADEKSMIRLAKKLKKNNVAVDFVTFGDGIEEGEKNVLRAFVDTANSGENSSVSCYPECHQVLTTEMNIAICSQLHQVYSSSRTPSCALRS